MQTPLTLVASPVVAKGRLDDAIHGPDYSRPDGFELILVELPRLELWADSTHVGVAGPSDVLVIDVETGEQVDRELVFDL